MKNESTFVARSINGAIAIASVFFVVEAFFLQQLALTAIALVVLLIKVLRAYLHPRWFLHRRKQLMNIGVYAASALMTIPAFLGNNMLAEANAKKIIAAAETYHREAGHYPTGLQELVPQYLPSIPIAKISYGFASFTYIAQPPQLRYVVLPPFGRKIYFFQEQRWDTLD
jgi:hypothetical protein